MTREYLLMAAQALCNDFTSQKDVNTLLSYFSTSVEPEAYEHGKPALAPFLGHRFSGHEGIETYFGLLVKHILYKDMQFSEYLVDMEEMKVAVKGQAVFTWVSTGEHWEETFAYVLDYDKHVKLKRYQVWADSGAAYLARLGQLEEVRVHALEGS
ncbi:hypothetical protein BU17DRAFT_69066 [Hysterangium stoloniferum]|nr:hypothetical protein BU17DRAFT_69066 [Hysterangium stoloniferum]